MSCLTHWSDVWTQFCLLVSIFFLCFWLKRENNYKDVTQKQVKCLCYSCPGPYNVFAPKPFSVCSEEVGHFVATYALFKSFFNQFGGFLLLLTASDHLLFMYHVLGDTLKVPYTFALQCLKKPPDPRRLVYKSWQWLSCSMIYVALDLHEICLSTNEDKP